MTKAIKILVATNAFKGSLSAIDAAYAIARGIKSSGLKSEIDIMPIADGGDDTLDVLMAESGELRHVEVSDALGRPLRASYGLTNQGRTAIIEMARAAGLKLLAPEERDPMKASTHGVGQLMIEAARMGVEEIIVGVGGSATVDGGAGCLQALGIRLVDHQGQDIPPGAGALERLHKIDVSTLDPGIQQVNVVVACDVDNPALGENGAAVVFGPQKGASPEDVQVLEKHLGRFFELAARQTGRDSSFEPRGGAAGPDMNCIPG